MFFNFSANPVISAFCALFPTDDDHQDETLSVIARVVRALNSPCDLLCAPEKLYEAQGTWKIQNTSNPVNSGEPKKKKKRAHIDILAQ